MLITDKSINHWVENFYGYGSWEAKIWFIGFEESGGDLPEEVAEKLDYFQDHYASAAQPTLIDVRALYRHVAYRTDGPRANLYFSLYDYRFGSKAVLHGSWKNLIAFVHGYRNEPLPDLLTYQRNLFTLESRKSEAFLQLYPLPAHNHAWYYSWLDLPQSEFIKTRNAYEEHVYPKRIHRILENISRYKPDIVVMFGMENINALKNSFQKFFPGLKFGAVKATKLQIPQHHYASVNGTEIIITTQIPALRHNRKETGFDWYEFGKTKSQ